jgi:predicted Fe-Mo cluster-binding NifX family protein
MKIAITASGKTLNSQVDQRFGRAAYFIVLDPDTMDFRVLDNEDVASAGGAGISSAKNVIDSGAEAVLTGNCGPNAERTLTAAGIKIYTGVSGQVSEAVELFKSGKLTKATEPDVQTHFGKDK